MSTLSKQCKCPDQDRCKHKWREQVQVNGVRKWISLHQSKTVSRRISDKRRGDRALLDAGIPVAAAETVYLLAAHIQDYMTHAKADHPATAETKDEPTLAAFLKAVGNQDLKQIDHAAIDRWRQGRLKVFSRGRLLSKATVNRELNIIKGCLRYAETLGRLALSPGRKVQPWKTGDYQRRILETPAEYELIRTMPMPYSLINRVTLLTLCRLAEVCRLQRHDLSPAHAAQLSITVRRKGGRIDKVPVDVALMKELRAQLKTSAQVYLFPHAARRLTTPRANAWAEAWLCPSNVSVFNTRFFREHGLPGVSNHALRHTGTTNQLEAGTDASTLQQMGGWSSRRMLDTYGHVTANGLRKAADTARAHYDAVIAQAATDAKQAAQGTQAPRLVRKGSTGRRRVVA